MKTITLTHTLSLLLTIHVIHSKRWDKRDYPDPLDFSSSATDRCNTQQGHICDPDDVLTKDEGKSVMETSIQVQN